MNKNILTQILSGAIGFSLLLCSSSGGGPGPFMVTTLAGSTSGDNNGTGTAAQFNNPYGVAVDSSGPCLCGGYLESSYSQDRPSGRGDYFCW